MDASKVGAALRQQAASGGGLREVAVDDPDLERAFNDDAGSIPRGARGVAKTETGAYLEPIGGKNVQTTPDVRALQNMRERAAKRQEAAKVPSVEPARPVPLAAETEDWEVTGGTLAVSRDAGKPQEPPEGDMLEWARKAALSVFGRLPAGLEVFVGGSGMDQQGIQFVMGVGLLVGKGQVAYRGNNCYRVTDAGRKAFREENL